MTLVRGNDDKSTKEETQLSKHNYSQYSNKNQNKQNQNNQNQQPKQVEVKKPEVKMENVSAVDPVAMNETVETVALPNQVSGVVAHCAKLNVRKNPDVNAAVICVLDVMSEVKIDVNKSTENWYYVCCANGAEGYCMKPYIDAHM